MFSGKIMTSKITMMEILRTRSVLIPDGDYCEDCPFMNTNVDPYGTDYYCNFYKKDLLEEILQRNRYVHKCKECYNEFHEYDEYLGDKE